MQPIGIVQAQAPSLPMTRCIPVPNSPGFRFCNGGDVSITQDEHSTTVVTRTVRVECHRCLATRFGYPNDEALPGDPLFSLGLKHYDVVEVIDSPWLAEINSRNKICFPNFQGFKARHFYIGVSRFITGGAV